MEVKQETPVVQAAPVEPTVETTAPVTEVPVAAPAAPAVSAETAPPQADQATKGKDAQARINQLTARYKLTEEALDAANAEIARLKSAGTAPAAPAAESNNPYAPTDAGGEVGKEDLEGLPPVVRQLVEEHEQEKQEKARSQKLTEWEETVGKGFEAFPELAGTVDDSAIALELKTRRVPLFNADLVFASQALPVVRSQLADAKKRIAELEAELHKDTVAAPRNGSTLTAPPDGAEPVYKPGEKMAEARRKAAAQH